MPPEAPYKRQQKEIASSHSGHHHPLVPLPPSSSSSSPTTTLIRFGGLISSHTPWPFVVSRPTPTPTLSPARAPPHPSSSNSNSSLSPPSTTMTPPSPPPPTLGSGLAIPPTSVRALPLPMVSLSLSPLLSLRARHPFSSTLPAPPTDPFQHENGSDASDGSDDGGGGKPDKKAGRRKIKIEFISDKSRRHITFSKRKAGIMKKVRHLLSSASPLFGLCFFLFRPIVLCCGLFFPFSSPRAFPNRAAIGPS